MIRLANAVFVRSAVSEQDFPRDGRPHVAFAGRSNVGKSTLINALLGRKNFARTGGTPGKTTNINLFDIDGKLWLSDLPGYGFAKVSINERRRWGELLETYFASGLITCGVLIVDIRHPPTKDDAMMARWFIEREVPFIVVANKSDKLKPSALPAAEAAVKSGLMLPDTVKVFTFSALAGHGKDKILAAIASVVGDELR